MRGLGHRMGQARCCPKMKARDICRANPQGNHVEDKHFHHMPRTGTTEAPWHAVARHFPKRGCSRARTPTASIQQCCKTHLLLPRRFFCERHDPPGGSRRTPCCVGAVCVVVYGFWYEKSRVHFASNGVVLHPLYMQALSRCMVSAFFCSLTRG